MSDLLKSELVIAKILELLMDWGIQETQLEFKELGLSEEYAPHFFPCVEWLKDEGVIRTGKVFKYLEGGGSGIVSGPVLTSYGLAALGHKITVGENEEKLSEAVKEVSSGTKSYSNIGDLVGGILGGFTKSISS
ncbi:hypothetical protein FEE96_02555 [Parasedimentitalea maritima]|uniref:DUF2513 domain-containing protein n=1 Tax=Parasedimentitalea maritima TaxID=2578117 RepID=A0ABY2V0E4_9RHOB|nr:hypothetical protein [Zongyanglinia marina]TLP69184.1 hypothetical protein FEE96_02555 [Zongyanglinia marina]